MVALSRKTLICIVGMSNKYRMAANATTIGCALQPCDCIVQSYLYSSGIPNLHTLFI